MEASLHVDLLWTDLEDFAEHFEQALTYPVPRSFLLGDDVAWVAWNSHDESFTEDYFLSEEELSDLIENKNYVQAYKFRQQHTSKYYALHKVTKETITPWALVTATRYRRDRLKVTASDVQGWGFADRFQTWLKEGWEGAVSVKELDKAPMLVAALELTMKSEELTKAEIEIAKSLAQGMNDYEISEARVTSPKTVEGQRKALAKKLRIPANKNTIAELLKQLGY